MAQVQPTAAQPSCTSCSPGQYQSSAGQTVCVGCAAGQYTQGPVFEHLPVITLDGNTCAENAAGAAADLPMGRDPYTIEAVIKPTQMGHDGIVSWGNFGNGNQVNALRMISDGRLLNYCESSPIRLRRLFCATH